MNAPTDRAVAAFTITSAYPGAEVIDSGTATDDDALRTFEDVASTCDREMREIGSLSAVHMTYGDGLTITRTVGALHPADIPEQCEHCAQDITDGTAATVPMLGKDNIYLTVHEACAEPMHQNSANTGVPEHRETAGDPTDLFGPVIHTYTRAQAIADGVLHVGPGDDGEPVATIMQPDED